MGLEHMFFPHILPLFPTIPHIIHHFPPRVYPASRDFKVVRVLLWSQRSVSAARIGSGAVFGGDCEASTPLFAVTDGLGYNSFRYGNDGWHYWPRDLSSRILLICHLTGRS